MFNGIWSDLVHAARALAKARTFTVVCVVSLGIGMVPVIAVPFFARVIDLPPPGVDTKPLVELVTTRVGSRAATDSWSYPDFLDLQDAVTGVTLTGWVHGASKITSQTAGAQSQDVPTLFVSRNYFATINVKLAQGPGFGAAATPEVIGGHEFWQKQLGSD